MNRCARLRAIAHVGQILLGGATQELVQDSLTPGATLQDLGTHRLRDLERPERVFQILHPDLLADFPPLASLGARPNNLPVQLTPLIGREAEVQAMRDLLLQHDARVVILTGPGGTGKTRLGLQVGAELLDAFPDEVFFVDLAPIRNPERVVATIAQPLGVREAGERPVQELLQAHLREKQVLLVLDNFEQVLAAAAPVVALLTAAPGVKLLVTSRAALQVRGEHEVAVPPLALPGEGSRVQGPGSRVADRPQPSTLDPRPSTLLQYAAVELFVQRAVAIRADFTLTPRPEHAFGRSSNSTSSRGPPIR